MEFENESWKEIEGYDGRYQNAAEALGLNEKTIRNIAFGKFKSNRKGYTITAIAKGGDVCEHFVTNESRFQGSR